MSTKTKSSKIGNKQLHKQNFKTLNTEQERKTRAFVAYACLAAAIIQRGEQANDESFLNSEWCAMLREMVNMAANIETRRLSEHSRGYNE